MNIGPLGCDGTLIALAGRQAFMQQSAATAASICINWEVVGSLSCWSATERSTHMCLRD